MVVLAASLIIAAIPIMDTFVAIVRRLKNHQPIQQADAKHLHHKLLREGFTPRKSVLIVYAWTAFLALGAYTISNSSGVKVFVVFVILAVVSFLVLLKLGIFEPVLRHHYRQSGRMTEQKEGAKAGERHEENGKKAHDSEKN